MTDDAYQRLANWLADAPPTTRYANYIGRNPRGKCHISLAWLDDNVGPCKTSATAADLPAAINAALDQAERKG